METIPLSLFPEQNDLDRIMHLYSETSANDAETIQFWRRNIQLYCQLNNTLQFCISDISNYFSVQGIIPSSLLICSSKLHQQGILLYPESLPRNTIMNMAINYLSPITSDSILISIDVLDRLQSEILSAAASKKTDEDSTYMLNGYDSIDDSSTFYSFIRSICLKLSSVSSASINQLPKSLQQIDIPVLVNYLVRNKVASISPDKSFIKLKSGLSGIDITDVDIAKVQLKRTISRLENRIAELNDKANNHHAEAVKSNQRQDKSNALFHLKLKKITTEAREKALSALLTLVSAAHVWLH